MSDHIATYSAVLGYTCAALSLLWGEGDRLYAAGLRDQAQRMRLLSDHCAIELQALLDQAGELTLDEATLQEVIELRESRRNIQALLDDELALRGAYA